jgi:hypothetical protein
MNSLDSGKISASESHNNKQEVGKGPIHERAEYWVVSKKDQI